MNNETSVNGAPGWDDLAKLLRLFTPRHDAWSCLGAERLQEFASNIEDEVGEFKPVLGTPMGKKAFTNFTKQIARMVKDDGANDSAQDLQQTLDKVATVVREVSALADSPPESGRCRCQDYRARLGGNFHKNPRLV